MVNKVQVGTVGGIRKVIRTNATSSTGTTISGLEGATLTLAQLQKLLDINSATIPTNPGTPSSGGGGTALTVEDGTTTVSNVSTILVSGGVVSQPTAGEAKITVTGSTNNYLVGGNVTPDTHPATPAALNDEFEGTSLDPKWVWTNQGGATVAFAEGCLLFHPDPAATGDNNNIILQPMSNSTWTIETKYACAQGASNNASFAFIAYNSVNGRYIKFGSYNPSTFNFLVQRLINPTLFSSNPLLGSALPISPSMDGTNEQVWVYLRCVNDGTNLIMNMSLTGTEGSFVQIYTETLAAWMIGVTHVGLCVNRNASGNPFMIVDWFRDYSAGNTPATNFTLANAANPSAVVGLTTVNGSANSFMRSDAAPALDVTISPIWTGNQRFEGVAGANNAALSIQNTDSVTYGGIWFMTNKTAGASAINKFFRIDSTGDLQIVNSAYTSVLFQLADAGNTTISAPTSGNTLTLNGVAGGHGLVVQGALSGTNAQGVVIFAGSVSSDVPLKVANAANTSNFFQINGDGSIAIGAIATTTSSPSAGGAGALPATPAGYMTVTINGTARKLPYY